MVLYQAPRILLKRLPNLSDDSHAQVIKMLGAPRPLAARPSEQCAMLIATDLVSDSSPKTVVKTNDFVSGKGLDEITIGGREPIDDREQVGRCFLVQAATPPW